jgi:hypothetical protein
MEKQIRGKFRIDIASVSNTGAFIIGMHDFKSVYLDTKEECYNWIRENGKYEYTITEIYYAL